MRKTALANYQVMKAVHQDLFVQLQAVSLRLNSL